MGSHASKLNNKAIQILEACAKGEISVLIATRQLQDVVSMAPAEWRFVGLGDCFSQMFPRFKYSSHAQCHVVNVMIKISKWFEERGEGNLIDHCMQQYLKKKDSKTPEYDRTEDLNTAAFIAHLANACHYGPIYIAIKMIADALEKGHKEELGKAALCMTYAGPEIFMCIVERVLKDEFADCYSCGPSYIGPETGLKRWRFWERTFAASAKDMQVCELYRDLAAQAAGEMKAIVQGR